MDGLAGWFLEAGRPIALISAQLMYMVTPFFGRGAEVLGKMLESDEESDVFLRMLRSDVNRESKHAGSSTR